METGKALYIVCRRRLHDGSPLPPRAEYHSVNFPSGCFVARSFWLVPGTDPEDPFYKDQL